MAQTRRAGLGFRVAPDLMPCVETLAFDAVAVLHRAAPLVERRHFLIPRLTGRCDQLTQARRKRVGDMPLDIIDAAQIVRLAQPGGYVLRLHADGAGEGQNLTFIGDGDMGAAVAFSEV